MKRFSTTFHQRNRIVQKRRSYRRRFVAGIFNSQCSSAPSMRVALLSENGYFFLVNLPNKTILLTCNIDIERAGPDQAIFNDFSSAKHNSAGIQKRCSCRQPFVAGIFNSQYSSAPQCELHNCQKMVTFFWRTCKKKIYFADM